MTKLDPNSIVTPFNGPLEVGLRALVVLSEAFPQEYSLQSLVIFDYLIVHSDDLPHGPSGLHPKTPYRSGELLVRRRVLERGLQLYSNRNLVACNYTQRGLYYCATERSASFLDALQANYLTELRSRAAWVISELGELQELDLQQLIDGHLEDWGAEFETTAILWQEDLT